MVMTQGNSSNRITNPGTMLEANEEVDFIC